MLNITDYKPISDYSAIGNLRTVALVGRDGSIDWCCFPHIGRGSVFAAILDAQKGGRFHIAPAGVAQGEQHYIEDTNIIETIFNSDGGRLTVTDFMPLWKNIDTGKTTHAPHEIHRLLRCEGGRVDVEIEWSPRLDYARVPTEIERVDGGWMANADNMRMVLGGIAGGEAIDRFGPVLRARLQMRDGEQKVLVTRWDSDDAACSLEASMEEQRRTIDAWRSWVHKERAIDTREWAGKWLPQVVRSELALKLLVHADTGAIAAAPTTSLPETIGGVRNWDYRYTWIRDAALTIQALSALGHEKEAIDFLYWAERVSEARGEEGFEVQIMYGLHGETDLQERELPHLEGYRGSRPVRIGNGAAEQLQLDIYGELLDSGYELLRRGHKLEPKVMNFLSNVANRACEIWQTADFGIWEIRDKPRHFVYSKVMVWLALHRAVHLSEKYGLPGDAKRWRRARNAIYNEVLKHGYNTKVGAFTQAFDTANLDASNLLIPMHEFLPFEDPRVQGTIDRTIEQLMENNLVYRYRADDGLPGKEGGFGLCTFWLIDVLALSGRLDEAWNIFEATAARANHVGLFSEQFDPRTGEFLGNFPQAFSHIGLINSILFLSYAEGKKIPGPALVGTLEHRAESQR